MRISCTNATLEKLKYYYEAKQFFHYISHVFRHLFFDFQFNKAYKLLLESQKFNHKESFIEKAKLLWARENQVS